jgi:hypothetical protein
VLEEGVMTLRIELRPEKEDLLRHEAARRGMSMETYAKLLVEESLPTWPGGGTLSAKDEGRLLDELAELGKDLAPSPPGETYSRETIYAEHD